MRVGYRFPGVRFCEELALGLIHEFHVNSIPLLSALSELRVAQERRLDYCHRQQGD